MSYLPQDRMSLWWLAAAQAPQRIGTLSLQDQRRKVALSYDPAWIDSPQGLGYQQMRVGAQGHESSLVNALSEARAFGLSDAQARQTVAEIATQVAQWKTVFKPLNVRDADIALLAQYLDGAHLREQRRWAIQ